MTKLMEREYLGEFTFTRQWNQAGRPEGIDIKNYPMGRFTLLIDEKEYHIPEELGYWLHTIDYYKQPKKKKLGFGKTPINCEKINNNYQISLKFPYYDSNIKLKVLLSTENNVDLDIEKIKKCSEHTINCGEEFDWGNGKVSKEIFDLALKKDSKQIRKIVKRKYVADINLSDGQGGEDHYKNFENRLFRILIEKKIDTDWSIILINRSLKIHLNDFKIESHPWEKNFKNGGIVKDIELSLIGNDKENIIYKNNCDIPNDINYAK